MIGGRIVSSGWVITLVTYSTLYNSEIQIRLWLWLDWRKEPNYMRNRWKIAAAEFERIMSDPEWRKRNTQ